MKGEEQPLYLVCKRPLEERIVFPSKEHQEEGHVSSFAPSLAIQIEPHAEFVTISRCVEC